MNVRAAVTQVRQTLSFITAEDGKTLTPRERKQIHEVSLARALAVCLALPTSPVNSLSGYYNRTHQSGVNDILSQYNEHQLIDVKLVQSLVWKIYRLRYEFVFEPKLPSVRSAVDTLIMVSDTLSSEYKNAAWHAFGGELDEVVNILAANLG